MEIVSAILREAFRVCKINGRVIFDYRNIMNPWIFLSYKTVFLHDPDIKVPLRAFTRRQIRYVLQSISIKEVIYHPLRSSKDYPIKSEYPLSLSLLIKTFLVFLVVRPRVYGIIHPLISRFKLKELHEDFDLRDYTPFQAGVGLSLLRRLEELSIIRNRNGMRLLNALKGVKGYILPHPLEGSFVAFSQFPLIVEDKEKVERLQKKLRDEGIEATRMLSQPYAQDF